MTSIAVVVGFAVVVAVLSKVLDRFARDPLHGMTEDES